jgi:hypothetical protein
VSEHHRPEAFARLRKLPLVGRAADWGLGPSAASKHTMAAGSRIAGLEATASVCPYRAVGCSQLVSTRGGELVGIEGNPRRPAPTRGPRPRRRRSNARLRFHAALESAAMTAELALSALNDRRLGIAGRALESGTPGRRLKIARALNAAGLAGRAARALAPGRGPEAADHVPSALFLAAALLYRLGWVAAGRPSALDHEAVAALARDPAAKEND